MKPFYTWAVQSQERFITVNALLVGLPFGVGWFFLFNDRPWIDAILISLLAGILFGVLWSWAMWHSFIIKRLRQAVERRASRAEELTSKHL